MPDFEDVVNFAGMRCARGDQRDKDAKNEKGG